MFTVNKNLSRRVKLYFSKMDRGDWNALPTLVLHQIFTYLPQKSRLAASSTCKHWRSTLYHPLFWQYYDLNIYKGVSSIRDIEAKVDYVNSHILPLVRSVRLSFDSRSPLCFELATTAINALLDNLLLKKIKVEIEHQHGVFTKDEYIFNGTPEMVYLWSLRNYLEYSILNIAQRRNLEEFSFGYVHFYCWHDLISMLAKHSRHSIKRLELMPLESSLIKELSNNSCFISSTFNNLTLLTNLQKLSLDLNLSTCNLLPALCTMPQLETLVLRVLKKIDVDISDDVWVDLKKNCPKLGLRLAIIECKSVVKKLHRKLLTPSMPLTHLKVLFCDMLNVRALRKLIDYRGTLESLIWVDDRTENSTSLLDGHWRPIDIDPFGGDIESNPLIILSWVCTNLKELVIHGYFMENVDISGIARLRGPNLKRFELLEEDICFNRPWNSMIFDDVVEDVTKWIGQAWKPLRKENVFRTHAHYTIHSISDD